MIKISRKHDLTGQRFARLVVIKCVGTRHMSRLWLCKCDCGNEKEITTHSLRQNVTRSCGCLQKEVRSNKPRQKRLPYGESTRNKLLCDYKNAARRRNLIWELTDSQTFKLFESNCKLCNLEPQTLKYKHSYGEYKYTGIDRIDNSKGYTTDNVQSLCKRCNVAKNNMTNQEFFEWIKRIVENYNG